MRQLTLQSARDHDGCFAVEYLTRTLLGRRVRVRSADRDVGEYLAAVLAGGTRPAASTEPVLELRLARAERGSLGIWVGDAVARGSVPEGEAPARALAALNRRLCFPPGPLVAVHAGAAARDGTAVVLLGASGAGKSTLAASLTRAGWTYLSDEAAGIDEHGHVHPYARPITLRPGAWTEFPEIAGRLPPGHERFATGEWHVPPTLLGAVGEYRMPPTAVVEIDYQEGQCVALRSIGRGEALERMAAHACNLKYFGQEGLERLARAVRRSECYRLAFGDVTDAVTALERLR